MTYVKAILVFVLLLIGLPLFIAVMLCVLVYGFIAETLRYMIALFRKTG